MTVPMVTIPKKLANAYDALEDAARNLVVAIAAEEWSGPTDVEESMVRRALKRVTLARPENARSDAQEGKRG